MVAPRRILCLSALLAVLFSASADAAGEDSVPAAFWQDGSLHVFARLNQDPGAPAPAGDRRPYPAGGRPSDAGLR